MRAHAGLHGVKVLAAGCTSQAAAAAANPLQLDLCSYFSVFYLVYGMNHAAKGFAFIAENKFSIKT